MKNKRKYIMLVTLSLVTPPVLSQVINQPRIVASTVQNEATKFKNSNCMLLDVARRHLTYQQLVQIINEIDSQKFPYLQLHLSDNQGFAIQTSLLNNQGWITKTQMTSLCKLAQSKSITIIPDIDVPSHCASLIHSLKSINRPLAKRITMDNETLDYTNPETTKFVKQLYQEVLRCFPQKDIIMIGSDEVPGNVSCAQDLSSFLNQINTQVRQLGWKQTLVWNDSINPQVQKSLSRDIMIIDWNHSNLNSLQQNFQVKDAFCDDPSNMNMEDLDEKEYTQDFIDDWNSFHKNTPGYLSIWSNGRDGTTQRQLLEFINQIQD